MKKWSFLYLLLWIGTLLSSCGKESVNMEEGTVEAYYPLQAGKYIIYQLDSIVKVPFQDTAFTTISYQAKDVVDTIITDNLGRKSWRVFRYLRPVNSNNDAAWTPDATYYVTPTRSSVEVVDNNLRFLKLVYPVKENSSWKGNTYINTTPGGPLDYLDAWEYAYSNIGAPFTPLTTPVDSTITILQADEGIGYADDIRPLDIHQDAYRTYSVEVYAKNTGLIYKYLTYWTFEAAAPPVTPIGKKQGAGIRLRMISHN